MTVRKMTIEDISGAVAVDEAAFSKPWSEKSFIEEIEKDYSYYFVSEENNQITGYAGIWCIYETAELIRIAVTPKFQGRGIAKSLMEKILSTAKECGCERMMLEVRKSNISARGLYEKFGFSQISIRRGYYDGEDAVIMEKQLG